MQSLSHKSYEANLNANIDSGNSIKNDNQLMLGDDNHQDED